MALLALCSCSEELTVRTDHEGESGDLLGTTGVTAIMHDFEVSPDCDDNFTTLAEEENKSTATRSSMTLTGGAGSTLKFAWRTGDQLAVFSTLETSRSKQIYNLDDSDDGKASAHFSSNDFNISDVFNYYSFSPTTDMDMDHTHREDVHLDYSGQVQTGNNSTAHLGAKNYMASYQVPRGESIGFDFKKLSCPINFRIALPEAGRFTSFEILRADGEMIKYNRMIDLPEGGEPGEKYAPFTHLNNEIDETNNPGHGYLLQLRDSIKDSEGNFTGNYNDYIKAEACTDPVNHPEQLLSLWVMFPKTKEFVGKSLIGKLVGKNSSDQEVKYYFTINGYEITDTYKYFNKMARVGTLLHVSLKVNKQWTIGNTQEQTRASQGDPGVDEGLKEPKYIYLYTCKDGKFDNAICINTSSTTADEGKNERWAGWTETDKDWTYNHTFAIDVNEPTTDVHTYVIASYEPITDPSSGWSQGGTDESTVRDFTYSITDDDDAAKQTMLKNLYSADYQVLKGKDMIMPITLNHVAAKMDIQWNNTTGTALTGNVTVAQPTEGLPTTGLKMFKPTACGGSNTTWSPSTTITTGTQWNGRAVFYVPQLENQLYNITIGTSGAQDIQFTAPTTSGKTAWFKGNVTITH